MNIIKPRSLDLVLRLSRSVGITFYDSSYIIASIENNLVFVTEDKKLVKKIHEKHSVVKKILKTDVLITSIQDIFNNKINKNHY